MSCSIQGCRASRPWNGRVMAFTKVRIVLWNQQYGPYGFMVGVLPALLSHRKRKECTPSLINHNNHT